MPWIDAKCDASTQVMDEARHVEVFAKYLATKLSGHPPQPRVDDVQPAPLLEDRPQLQEARLLDPNAGWLRKRFQEIGVIQFEDWVDTGEDYDSFALGIDGADPSALSL